MNQFKDSKELWPRVLRIKKYPDDLRNKQLPDYPVSFYQA
jgi:hypothetical protein